MAGEAGEGLGKTPDALGKRERAVALSDGTTVIVHKWSVQKQVILLALVGLLPEVPTLAVESVSEADRDRVRALDFDDLLAISTAATELNVTERTLKNLQTLLDQRKGLEAALKVTPSPSKVS